jgi:hypothetical protein
VAGFTGTLVFTSSDPAATFQDAATGAMLAGNAYTFTAADHGTHAFTVTLQTAGAQTVGVAFTGAASPSGGTTITVNPAAADHLVFLQQPTDTAAGQTISPVIVEVVDQFGNLVTTDNTDTVTLSIGVNPSGGTLSGTLTVTVSGGQATFGDLSIDMPGSGYTLHATVGGSLPDIDSNPFNVT